MSRGQERRYSRGRSLDGIHDADRLMQRENAKLVIDVGSPTRFGLSLLPLPLSLFLPARIDSARMAQMEISGNNELTLCMFIRENVSL